MGTISRAEKRIKRQKRVRRKVRGDSERPRLCVFRSANHIYAQLIDDVSGKTLVSVSTVSKDMKDKIGENGGNITGAKIIGSEISERALGLNIKKAVFDRNGFLYHGRVKALSEAAREKGLEF